MHSFGVGLGVCLEHSHLGLHTLKDVFFFFLIAFITKKSGQLKIAYAKKFAILLQCALIFETAL